MNMIKVVIRKIVWKLYMKECIPTKLFRYVLSYVYDKNKFKFRNEVNPFENIYDGDFWESNESKSGGGSTIEATLVIREFLQSFIKEYSISSILDTPCGDYNWMKLVEKENLMYIGGDIVPKIIEKNNLLFFSQNVHFEILDITKDSLPKVDLIFCRDCLQHLSFENVKKALNNFRNSGSKYLLTTSYSSTMRNYDILDGDYRALNLLKYPISYPKPLREIQESTIAGNEFDKKLYLYKVEDLPVLI